MRYNGQIIEWNDARGFGFATVPGSDKRYFVHIKSIAGRGRRPLPGDRVTFEIDIPTDKGPRAVQVRYAEQHRKVAATPARSGGTRSFAIDWALAAAVCAALSWNVLERRLPAWSFAALAVGSLLAFVMYNIDKRRAQRDARRTPEAELLAISAVGWLGALAAQQLFRHKSSKKAFYYPFRIIAVLETVALLWFGKAGPII